MRPKKPSKKQVILECCRERGFTAASEQELRILQADLERRLHGGGGTSLGYIARVLAEAGVATRFRAEPPMREPFASRLHGLLRFSDLASAEESLRNLDAVFCDYAASGDHHGIKLVRYLILKGKQRATQMALNPRVSELKRREKREIAKWFTVWLQTPGMFFDWLELRKQSEEFRREFPASGGEPNEGGKTGVMPGKP